jgi:ATP-dependent protease ClpP protease subunit
MRNNSRKFSAAVKYDVLEVLVYDVIGSSMWDEGVTAAGLAAQMKAAGKYGSISVRINSPGGSAFEGLAIANLLRAQGKPVNVEVDGVAASAASIIAMAGDRVSMGLGAMMMVHNARTMAYGQASDFREVADTLDKVSDSILDTYAARTKMDRAELAAMMDAETWLSAEDCISNGFADGMAENASPEARADAMKLAAEWAGRFENGPVWPLDCAREVENSPDQQWEGRIAMERKRLELLAA